MKFNNFDYFIEYFQIFNILQNDLFVSIINDINSKNHKLEYERLEFFGDALLSFLVAKHLIKMYPSYNEGELSKIKSFIVSRKMCYDVALDIGLDKILSVNNDQIVESTISCTMEVLIALIYHSYSESIVDKIISELFITKVDTFAEDSKMLLQEMCQKQFQSLPEYTIVNKQGTEHEPIFTILAKINKFEAIATGSNKKLAEKKAASILIELLKEHYVGK